jgi:glutamine synthetase
LEVAKETLDAEFLIGFEVEFEIMSISSEGQLSPSSAGLGIFAVSGLRDPCYKHVEEVVQILQAAGVKIDAFQTEGLRGQYEIALGPLPPIQAVDQLVLVQDTIKSVFKRHGLIATMSPRPVKSRRQSTGQHAHISINRQFMEELFLAGILKRLPELCSFCMPYDLSYERIQPYSAGTTVAWGTEDRTVPVRKIKSGHWEIRCIDATANMYLALAAILSAGLLGCQNKEPLVLPDTGSMTDPIYDNGTPLPRSVEEALQSLEETTEELQAPMRSRIVQHYIRVKKFETSKLGDLDSEKVRQLLVELF